MDYNTIKALIEKYFAGETTLAEEQQLRDYFQQENIADDLRQYQTLFGYFHTEKQLATSEAFDEQWGRPKSQRKSTLRIVQTWSIAAAVALLLTAGWYIYQDQQDIEVTPTPVANAIDWSQYEPKTEEEAIEVTKGALLRTSKAMYNGITKAASEVEGVKKIMEWD